jgi:flagellar basal-body rod modification protein FlgD
MAVTSATITSSSSSVAQSTRPNKFGDLTSEQFTKIMLSELQSQDPLKPNDSNALLQQVSSIRSIESNLSLEKKLGSILSQNQLASAGNLLGTNISGLTETNTRVSGKVVGVNAGPSGVSVTLSQGWKVPFNKIDGITLPPAAEAPNAPNNGQPAPIVPNNPPAASNPPTSPPVNPLANRPASSTPAAAPASGTPVNATPVTQPGWR